jgi:glyceraldehyde 3-phosphate dehydrogenase
MKLAPVSSKVLGNKAARYDTVHGRFKHDVKIGEKDELIVNGHKIKCIQASREGPKALPWKDSYFLIFIYFYCVSIFISKVGIA